MFLCGAAPHAEPAGVWLDVPFVSQEKNGCGAASIAMVVRYLVKMFDKNLVHAIIGGKDLDCGSAELSVNLGLTIGVWTRGHGSLLLDL
jgi:hypothetical protein